MREFLYRRLLGVATSRRICLLTHEINVSVPSQMRPFSDAVAKLDQAVDALATLPDSLQDRLFVAYDENLSRIESEGLPEEMAADLERIRQRLSTKSGPSPIRATLSEMTDEEAREIATLVMALARAVLQESYRRRYQPR